MLIPYLATHVILAFSGIESEVHYAEQIKMVSAVEPGLYTV